MGFKVDNGCESEFSLFASCRDTLKQARADLAALQRREAETRKSLEQKERRAADIAASVEDLTARVAQLKAELGTEMLAQLSAGERAELKGLAPQLKQLQVCKSKVGICKVLCYMKAAMEVLVSCCWAGAAEPCDLHCLLRWLRGQIIDSLSLPQCSDSCICSNSDLLLTSSVCS
jgi:hypothetical protein